MKNTFIKISRISLAIFAVAIAILVMYVVMANDDEIELPIIIGIFVLVGIILGIMGFLIAIVIDIVENYKKEGFSFVIKYAVEIIGVGALFVLYEHFVDKSDQTWIQCFTQASIIVLGIRAGSNVIFAKREKSYKRKGELIDE